MTYSHEQPKGWGFSRKPFDFCIFGNPQTKIGDFYGD